MGGCELGGDGLRHYAEFLLPGVLFPETTSRPLGNRDPAEAQLAAPSGAFAFTLYDLPPKLPEIAGYDIVPRRLNESGRYYLGGTIYSLEKLEEMAYLDSDYYGNCYRTAKANGWLTVIHCSTGNWHPFEDGDTYLPTPPLNYQTLSDAEI